MSQVGDYILWEIQTCTKQMTSQSDWLGIFKYIYSKNCVDFGGAFLWGDFAWKSSSPVTRMLRYPRCHWPPEWGNIPSSTSIFSKLKSHYLAETNVKKNALETRMQPTNTRTHINLSNFMQFPYKQCLYTVDFLPVPSLFFLNITNLFLPLLIPGALPVLSSKSESSFSSVPGLAQVPRGWADARWLMLVENIPGIWWENAVEVQLLQGVHCVVYS